MKYGHLITILFLCLLQACSGKPYAIKHHQDIEHVKNNVVLVDSHGWHTGFIISAADTEIAMPFLKERFYGAEYYEFGWGDKGFYQAEEITTGLTLQAIFWPTESVMHVVAVPFDPYNYFETSEIIEIKLSNTDLDSLLEFINSSFYRNENNKVVTLKNGIYGDSQFYKGEGDYYLFNTCNKWVAKGLESSGFDIFTTFKLTASSIMSYLRNTQIPAERHTSNKNFFATTCSS